MPRKKSEFLRLVGRSCVAAFLLGAWTTGALAQAPAQPPAGSRVRVEIAEETRPIEGTFDGWTETGLRVSLSDAGETLTVPRGDIVRLETMVRKGRRTKGALIGGSILAGSVLALYCAGGGCDAGGAAFGTAVFFGLGAAIGAVVSPGAEWQQVPVAPVVTSEGPRVSLGPAPGGGVAGSVSIGW